MFIDFFLCQFIISIRNARWGRMEDIVDELSEDEITEESGKFFSFFGT
jgi:hypothetical protein